MENTKVYKIIIDGLKNQLDQEIDILPESTLSEDLGLPSIKLVFFLTDVTEKLDISIMDFADYELLNLRTVADIHELLIKKI
jgi:acyl carrier protein